MRFCDGIITNLKNKTMSKEAEKFIEEYTTKDQDDWLVQKKDIIAKFMQSYHNEQLRISGVMQAKPEKVCTCNEITKDGGGGYCSKHHTDWL